MKARTRDASAASRVTTGRQVHRLVGVEEGKDPTDQRVVCAMHIVTDIGLEHLPQAILRMQRQGARYLDAVRPEALGRDRDQQRVAGHLTCPKIGETFRDDLMSRQIAHRVELIGFHQPSVGLG